MSQSLLSPIEGYINAVTQLWNVLRLHRPKHLLICYHAFNVRWHGESQPELLRKDIEYLELITKQGSRKRFKLVLKLLSTSWSQFELLQLLDKVSCKMAGMNPYVQAVVC
ncbi:hypothetical protein RCL1_006333 [Eukaryota sp. TZLM3-RCL]